MDVDESWIFGPTLHQASVVQLIGGRHVVSRKRRNQTQQGPRVVKFRNSKLWLSEEDKKEKEEAPPQVSLAVGTSFVRLPLWSQNHWFKSMIMASLCDS